MNALTPEQIADAQRLYERLQSASVGSGETYLDEADTMLIVLALNILRHLQGEPGMIDAEGNFHVRPARFVGDGLREATRYTYVEVKEGEG